MDARVLGARGVGRYLAGLLQGLSQLRHPHRFLVFLQPASRRDLVPQDRRFISVDIGRVNPAWAEQSLIPRRARALGADVLHFPDNSGAIRPGLPVVLTMHDTMWRRPLSQAIAHPTLRQRAQDAYRKWVCPRAAAAAAQVITISQHSRQCIEKELRIDPAKLNVVYEGVDSRLSKRLPAARAAALRQSLGVRGTYVLASGAADKRKNIDRLIEAFAQATVKPGPLHQARLVLTSLRPGEAATTTYAATAKRCKVETRLVSPGYVSDDQLKALYQGALCFAFPSLWEGFGLPLLEALSLGCPVLAAKAGALPEVGGRAVVYADPLSVASLSSGLEAACGREGQAALKKRVKVLAAFDLERGALQTLQVYGQAARRLS